MSLASEFQLKYGVLGAGAVGKSLIGALPRKTFEIGPVAAVSYRVASRIANVLRAGYSVRSVTELNAAPVILFHSPPEQQANLLELLDTAGIQWKGKALIFCDSEVDIHSMQRFEAKGAGTGLIRSFGIPGSVAVAGRAAALVEVRRIARAARMKPIEIAPAALCLFDSALMLCNIALTPLIDSAVSFACRSGVRRNAATRAVCALIEQTVREYAHSGKQSWPWCTRRPESARIEVQVQAAGTEVGPILRKLILLGFESFDRHPDIAHALRNGADVQDEKPV